MATTNERNEATALRGIPDRNIAGRAVRAFIADGVWFEPVIGGKDADGVYRTVYRAVAFA